MRKLFEIGGIVAGLVLVLFGAAAIYMGVDGRATVRDSLRQEQIIFGAADDPAIAKFASQLRRRAGHERHAGQGVRPGHPRARARGLRRLDLRADGPLRLRRRPEEPGRHERRGRRAEGRAGNPVSNSSRNTWITATALSTALNVSYMAEQMALFGIVVGIALLLSGIGFMSSHSARFTAASWRPPQAPGVTPRDARRGLVLTPRASVKGGPGPPLTLLQGAAMAHSIDFDLIRRRLAAGEGGYEIVHTSPGLELGVYVLVAPSPIASNLTKTTRSTSSSREAACSRSTVRAWSSRWVRRSSCRPGPSTASAATSSSASWCSSPSPSRPDDGCGETRSRSAAWCAAICGLARRLNGSVRPSLD